jgi:succinate dehydrogenase / fumarate reductase cytochrome b subunit
MADFEQTRPTFFNILRISFPVGSVASFAHRVSGIVMALCTPVLIYLLDVSLHSAEDYEWLRALLDTLLAKALMLVAVWAFTHHFLAGIRHLLMDIDVGSSLPAARRSAWLVNIAGIAVSLLGVGMLA